MPPIITPQQWDEHKEEILKLYIDEGLALKPVMRKMRKDGFDPTESQYRTRLKKWQRRKPRNRHQPGPVAQHDVPIAAASATPFAGNISRHCPSQSCVPASDDFTTLEASETARMVPPLRGQLQWPNVAGVDGATESDLQVVSHIYGHVSAQESNHTTPHWQDMTPFDPTTGEVYPSLPDAWRKERKRAAALGYSSTGQPRTERSVRKRIALPSRQSKEAVPRATEVATSLQDSTQPAWTAQSSDLGSSLPSPHRRSEGEGLWWHGNENGLLAYAADNQGGERHFLHHC